MNKNYTKLLLIIKDQLIYQPAIILIYYLEQFTGLILLGIIVVYPTILRLMLKRNIPIVATSILYFILLVLLTFNQTFLIQFDLITICVFPFTHWVGLLIARYLLN